MTLRLVGSDEREMGSCPRCGGTGRVPCPPRQAIRTGVHGINAQGGPVMVPGAGAPIPCPMCLGKKIVPVGDAGGGGT